MLRCKLTDKSDVKDLDDIRAWAIANSPSHKTSTHWWHTAPSPKTPPSAVLPETQKSAFDRIATCKTIRDMFESRFAKVAHSPSLIPLASCPLAASICKLARARFWLSDREGGWTLPPFSGRCLHAAS